MAAEGDEAGEVVDKMDPRMKERYVLRVNGRGNAWPIPIAQVHPFYSLPGAPDYANASYSLLERDEKGKVVRDLLVDAGHGIVPFLLRHGNRIPDAMLITHPHFDHTLGMDWIIQSYYRFRGKKRYPVYATRGCREQILATMPHLEELVAFTDLSYGEAVEVKEMGEGITVTAFPVYHGPHARAAAMLLVEVAPARRRLLFTGDVLLPLLRERDLERLGGVDWLITDANNRFPYPKSNHWSVSRHPGDEKFLEPWLEEMTPDKLMAPHNHQSYANYQYLLGFFEDFPDKKDYLLTVLDFAARIRPGHLLLAHYSGLEDEKYYGEKLLDTEGLRQWSQRTASSAVPGTTVRVPETGEILSLRNGTFRNGPNQ